MAIDPKDVKTAQLPGVELSAAEKLAIQSCIAVSVAARVRARQKEVVGSELYQYYSRDIDSLNRLKEKFV